MPVQARPLHVLLDGRYISDHFPGIGRYIYQLAGGLAQLENGPQLTLLHNPNQTNNRYDLAGLARQNPGRLRLLATEVRPFSLTEQGRFFRLAGRVKFDLWHAPYYLRPYLLPVPSVLTAYDVIADRVPDSLPSRRARWAFRVASRLAFRASKRIIAISQATAGDIEQLYRVPPDKITVVPLAAGKQFHPQSEAEQARIRARLQLPRRYLLYVGINKPHKNLAGLLKAFKLYLEESRESELMLVLAGPQDPRYLAGLRELARHLDLAGRVIFQGRVDEADLPGLYAGAELFVFPSLYEGFGLPVLEAMACGAPVICARNSALPEVAGQAALYFEAGRPDEIARTIAAGLDRRAELSRRSLEQARRFSWRLTAEKTLAVYREALTSGNRDM